ncbi:WhiB family transcriptional regulator [Kitasatospora sp. NPDC101235]|uniref:WhiB family transcriptional regulator n=1 Tax=Kitasatospora sp. NPDC101235 TaxID=3364101 RepID=UPI00380ABBEC
MAPAQCRPPPDRRLSRNPSRPPAPPGDAERWNGHTHPDLRVSTRRGTPRRNSGPGRPPRGRRPAGRHRTGKGASRRRRRCAPSAPVLLECRRYAIAAREPYGAWGGRAEDERRVLLGRRRTAPRAAA